jgi:Domain of unknown function (DUF4340)
MRNKHLVLLFLSICLGAWLFQKMPSKATSDFQKSIVSIDTNVVTQVILQTQGEKETLVFDRLERGWMVTYETQTIQILSTQMDSILGLMSSIRSSKKFTTNKQDWNKYGVGNKQGMRVQVFGNKGRLDDFTVSKCKEQNKPIYLRLGDSPEIYEVDFPMICAQKVNFADLRSRKIYTSIEENIQLVNILNKAKEEKNYAQSKGLWFQTENKKVDKTGQMRCFFEALSGLKLERFADDFNDSEKNDLLLSEITLHQQRNEEVQLIKLTCYQSIDNQKKYILHSSENPHTYFYSNDSLIQVIFLK